MTFANYLRSCPALLLGLGVAQACSLMVPSEEELFGEGPPASGGAGGGSSGSTTGGSKAPGGAGGMDAAAGNEGEAGDDGVGEGGGGGEPSQTEAGAGGESGSGPIVLPPAELLLHYTFDDVSQYIAFDETLNALDGTLAGASLPIGVPGHVGGALQLNGAQKQYVQLPENVLKGHDAVSISAWIKLAQALAWDRLFDFNSGESNWFYFSPTGWNSTTSSFGTRVATRNPSVLAPEIMMTETVSINTWHHIVVVFAKPYLRYYLDGVLKGQVDDMPFATSDLAPTTSNWIGRSVYAPDPYLSALVDEFRIYTGALTAEQVTELAAE